MYNGIMRMFPNAGYDDFVLQDDGDGKGVYIAQWNTAKLGDMPSVSEILVAEEEALKEEAFNKKLAEIDEAFNNSCDADFFYKGDSFKADYTQIQGMVTSCMLLSGLDPLPTATGGWTTTSFEADTVTPKVVPFTCEEFILFAKAIAERRSLNFKNKNTLESQVRQLFIDASTSLELLAFNAIEGWRE